MKPLFTHERALHFVRETVIGASEGVLFFAISILFTAAGVTALLEGGLPDVQVVATATAKAPPPAPVAAKDKQKRTAPATTAVAGSSSQPGLAASR